MRPRVVVRTGRSAPPAARSLLTVLARRAEVRGPGLADADVELVFGVDVPRLEALLTGAAPVVAVCSGGEAQTWNERLAPPALALCSDDVDAWRHLDPDALDGDAFPPRSPYVRERLRSLGVEGGLATVPAAAVELAEARVALALATPCVVTAETALALGATDGVDVVVATPDETDRALRELAAAPYHAARISTGARMLFEARHDLAAAARAICAVAGRPDLARDRVRLELDRLRTPLASPVAVRALRNLRSTA